MGGGLGSWREPLRQFAHYSTAGIMFPVSVALGFILGWAVDGWLGTAPWGSLLGAALGTAAAIRNLLRTVASDTGDGDDGGNGAGPVGGGSGGSGDEPGPADGAPDDSPYRGIHRTAHPGVTFDVRPALPGASADRPVQHRARISLGLEQGA